MREASREELYDIVNRRVYPARLWSCLRVDLVKTSLSGKYKAHDAVWDGSPAVPGGNAA
jgi:hypothetical protein